MEEKIANTQVKIHGRYVAQSIGDQLALKLSSDLLMGYIYSISGEAINIALNGQLVTIGKPFLGNGPYTVLLPAIPGDLGTLNCQEGAQVGLSWDYLQLCSCTIDLHAASIWESEWSPMEELRTKQIFGFLPQLKALVLREGDLRGLGYLLLDQGLAEEEDHFFFYTQRVLLEQAVPLIEAVKSSLVQGTPEFWVVLEELVGLGAGVRPAGDDFVLGFLSTLRYLETASLLHLPTIDLQSFTEQIKLDTSPLTATGVVFAAQGRAHELIRDVLVNVFHNRKMTAILSALRLLRCNTLSGTNILTGIIVAGEIVEKISSMHTG